MLRRLVPVIALFLFGSSLAFAQQTPAVLPPTPASELMLSWRSNGYSPAGFGGRVAASGGGTVLVLAEAIVNAHPTDLRKYEVRWYVNDELYTSGMGMQSISIPIDASHQDSLDVRVEIIGAPFTANLATLSVPLTDARAVIERHTGTDLHAGANLFTAVPYSFNVTSAKDLIYSWTVNGETPQASEDPDKLVVNYDGLPTDPLDIGLAITHPQNQDESSYTSLHMTPAQAQTP